ncbi:MAG: hypothetical protein H7099_06660 [Gemmatimonadaceae bacterium]|nr:hypothetical protein [Gemmatimonadaceae bacterium]
MELTCYVYPGWKPRIRAASSRRAWMDATPESFAYRCLPLNIANAHGWEILSPCAFEARWNGGSLPSDVEIRVIGVHQSHEVPVALFGQGTVTFHVAGILRTSPGWSLWVSGSPNVAKDGIAPLSGLVETDWSPYTFTMNWRFTRAHHWIRFDENEPFCFVFPVERNVVAAVEPTFAPIDDAPELKEQFDTWSKSRDAFHHEMARNPPTSPSDKWQKLYYRGVDAHGKPGTADHISKLRPHPFTVADAKGVDAPRCPVRPAPSDAPGGDDT